ncbi:FkbM family methyltransferase [Crocinitomicaceae bacterium]|nr:FkbM family methyltransferase [Crocinitomicaceae bacterium]MDC1244930.1 FkbM family methyltransferase [Crocinitomicaceae bacterium]
MVKELIQDGDVVIDIGANLGYFSKTFSRLSPNGKVICIEPLPQYYSILKHFLSSRKNIEIHNVALGKDAGEVTMILPKSNGMIRTGLPYISKSDEKSEHPTQQVQIVNPNSLLKNLSKIDYIKCDIEGFEWIVFQELKEVLKQYQPIVQIEISTENRREMIPFFTDLGYVQYGINNFKFVKEDGKQIEPGDYLFVPKSRKSLIIG